MNVTMHKCCQWGLTGAAIFILNYGCDKFMDHPFGGKNPKGLKDYNQVNLVGNNTEYNPAHIDAHLLNAWGIAFSASGIAWVVSTRHINY